MRSLLNRFVPLGVIARWWYVLLAGPAVGLLLAFGTDVTLLRLLRVVAYIVTEGPPSSIEQVVVRLPQEWRGDILLVVIGLLLSCSTIYLLEDIRRHIKHPNR